MKTRVFISHSAADAEIGERFLNFLLSIGFNKEEIFYSSKYHNGVELGKNFSDVVKENFIEAEIIVFLLTDNFYNSPFCLNEMGAAWISSDKEIVPILLGELSFNDMKGFLGSQTKTFSPRYSEKDELYSYFLKRTKGICDEKTSRIKYEEFLSGTIEKKADASELAEEATQILLAINDSKDGYIVYSDLLNNTEIKVNNRDICLGKNRNEKIKYKAAMEYLLSNDYVERKAKALFVSLVFLKAKGVDYIEKHSNNTP